MASVSFSGGANGRTVAGDPFLKGFAAAMLGGIGSAPGAVVGGILIGMFEALAAGYLSSNYKDAVAFLIILVVLVAIPQGLFGRAKIERV